MPTNFLELNFKHEMNSCTYFCVCSCDLIILATPQYIDMYHYYTLKTLEEHNKPVLKS